MGKINKQYPSSDPLSTNHGETRLKIIADLDRVSEERYNKLVEAKKDSSLTEGIKNLLSNRDNNKSEINPYEINKDEGVNRKRTRSGGEDSDTEMEGNYQSAEQSKRPRH